MTSDEARLTGLMERFVSLSSIEEQGALYDTLPAEDQAAMDERGLKRMWRSRRASEAHRRRIEQSAARLDEFAAVPPDERERWLAAKRVQESKAWLGRMRQKGAGVMTGSDNINREHADGGATTEKEQHMLLAADIDRAAATVQAMAEIPCLRGGIVPFDENLEAEGWREIDDEWGWIWVLVPDDGSDLAECRLKIEVALDHARRGLMEMIEALDQRDVSADGPDAVALLEEGQAERRDLLARLEVA